MSAGDGAATFEAEFVRLSLSAGVATITLDRPERLNAFAGTMRDDLTRAVEHAAALPGTRVLVISGAGRAFSAGADVDVMTDLLERGDRETFHRFVEAGIRAVQQIRAVPQPVIAALNGVAAGAGASLALACDVRIASERAQIGFTFNRIGLHPDWGATYFLPRLVGGGRASELLLSARMVAADEAERIGLFDRVLPADSFAGAVEEYARDMATKAPLALSAIKQSLAWTWDDDLPGMLAVEEAAQLRCFGSADVREGITAFREKRSPEFRGE